MKVKHHSAGAQQRERERERERGKQCLVEKVKVCLSSVTVDEILQFNSFQKDFYNF